MSVYRTIGPLVYTYGRNYMFKFTGKQRSVITVPCTRMRLLWSRASESNNFGTNLIRKDLPFTTNKQHSHCQSTGKVIKQMTSIKEHPSYTSSAKEIKVHTTFVHMIYLLCTH